MKITSKQGRWIEMELHRSVIYLDVFSGYRQQTEVYLNIDDVEFAGFSYLNPADIFDEQKGIKTAIRDALSNGALGTVLDDKEAREDIWQAVFQMLHAHKAIEGLKAFDDYGNKYGDESLYEILPAKDKEELNELNSALEAVDW